MLEVLDGLPEFARHGLFAQPRDYDVWVRLSNGGMDRARDSAPDIRGFALRVFGVQGESALGNGPAKSQDFTLINQEAFAFSGSGEFVDFVAAASHGNGALLKYLFKRYGFLGAPRQLGRMVKMAGKPFGGFATEPLFSALPMANGPYAVRVRLVPAASNGTAELGAREDWGRDFSARLARQPLHWDLQLQFFASEELTPIEDARVNWPTPYTTVARLMLPRQDSRGARRPCPGAADRSLGLRSLAGVGANTGRWATSSGPARWSISRARRAAARPEPCSSVGYRLHGVRGFAHRMWPGEGKNHR